VNGRNVLTWVIAPAIAGAILAGAYLTLAAARPVAETIEFAATDVTGVAWGRDFHLTGHDGRPRELADFRGKVVALYFGYTRCPDVCPLTMATLGQAVQLLGEDGARVQGVFVTVDPRRDKPQVLARYVKSFHEDFLGLYGNAAETSRVADEFKVEAGEHHSIPVFLIDPRGRLRLVAHPEASAESIAHDIRLLLQQAKS
jgi:protein SCO1/2